MAKSLIACRVQSYAPFTSRAYEHLASLGIGHVEIRLPRPEEAEATRAELERHGLSATSLQGDCDLSRVNVAGQIEAQMPSFACLGTRIMFLPVRAGDIPLQTAYSRLREAGDVAASHGVTIVLETHPDLITNSAKALDTMRGVNHPNVRINFDTANIYFYNRGVDAVEELCPMVPFVAAVHLKDTDGSYRRRHFPALGHGIVRFAEVFAVLDKVSFMGPYTIEIEGVEGETRTERLVCDRVAESVEFLRSLGRK